MLDRRRAGSLLDVLDETRTAMGGAAAAPLAAVPAVDVARHPPPPRRGRAAGRARTRRATGAQAARRDRRHRAPGRPGAARAWRRRAIWRCWDARWRSCRRWPRRWPRRTRGDRRLAGRRARICCALGDDAGAASIAARARSATRLRADAPARDQGRRLRQRRRLGRARRALRHRRGGREPHRRHRGARARADRHRSLKVKYNNVFGYYIEVTRAHLAHASRPTTAQADGGQRRALRHRRSWPSTRRRCCRPTSGASRSSWSSSTALRGAVAARGRARLLALAARVAAADALAALAEVAHRNGYCRPEVDDGGVIEIADARHPVVERLAAAGGFVPNDVRLDPDARADPDRHRPQHGGQVDADAPGGAGGDPGADGRLRAGARARASACAIASSPAWAPATTWRAASRRSWSRCARRRTSSATRRARSLVVLDEIGRGTSTYDGVSIAWAVAEHLHDRVRRQDAVRDALPRAGALAEQHPRVRNVSVAAREWKGEVVFLRKLSPGGASRSFGVEVGQAGRPAAAGGRPGARHPANARGRRRRAAAAVAAARRPGAPRRDRRSSACSRPRAPPAAPGSRPTRSREILERLRAVDPDELSPRAALDCSPSLVKKLTPAPPWIWWLALMIRG